MAPTRIVATSSGPVEVALLPGERAPVLFFPGGHCGAAVDCGWSLYTEAGHGIVAFSRPGYGRTRVGRRTAAEFAPLVREVCEQLEVTEVAASVGVSFGGMQAVHVAADPALVVPRLVLHSCAPSTLPYPDTRAEAVLGPIAFSPALQGLVWGMIHRMVRSEAGLKRMLARLSNLPIERWWPELNDTDRDAARTLFRSMRSDSGFVTDLRQGRADGAAARRGALAAVRCPTLVMGSPHDRGVSIAHARDFAASVTGAVLVELDSPSHLFWIGPGRDQLAEVVRRFVDG